MFEQVGTVGDGAQSVPLHDGADDLRKAQGGDGQVIALEAQHGQPDQRGKKRRGQAGKHQRHDPGQGKAQRAARVILVNSHALRHRNGEDGVGIGAYQHEACLAQGKQAGKAVEQVHGNGDQRIDRALLQHGHSHGIGAVFLLCQVGPQVDGRDHQKADDRLDDGSFFHLVHLTPFPPLFRRTGRWA